MISFFPTEWRELRLRTFLGSEHRELGRWQSSSICFWVRRNFRLTLLKLPGSIASEQNCPVFATGSSTLAVCSQKHPPVSPLFKLCHSPTPPSPHPTTMIPLACSPGFAGVSAQSLTEKSGQLPASSFGFPWERAHAHNHPGPWPTSIPSSCRTEAPVPRWLSAGPQCSLPRGLLCLCGESLPPVTASSVSGLWIRSQTHSTHLVDEPRSAE